MNIESIFVFLCVFALIAYWAHHNRIGSKAVAAAKNHTDNQGLQLLDQGAVLTKVRLSFTRRRGITLVRTFRFEFSSKGDKRYLGWVVMGGMQIHSVTLQPFSENTLN